MGKHLNETVKLTAPMEIRREGAAFIACCPLFDVSSQGSTQQNAKSNLIEAMRLFIYSCIEMKTLDQALKACETFAQQHHANPTGLDSIDLDLPPDQYISKTTCCEG